jgi:hypothetical protein
MHNKERFEKNKDMGKGQRSNIKANKKHKKTNHDHKYNKRGEMKRKRQKSKTNPRGANQAKQESEIK